MNEIKESQFIFRPNDISLYFYCQDFIRSNFNFYSNSPVNIRISNLSIFVIGDNAYCGIKVDTNGKYLDGYLCHMSKNKIDFMDGIHLGEYFEKFGTLSEKTDFIYSRKKEVIDLARDNIYKD